MMIAIRLKAGYNIRTDKLLGLLSGVGISDLHFVGNVHSIRLHFGMIVVKSAREKEVLKVLKALPIIAEVENYELKDFYNLPPKMKCSPQEWRERDRQ